MLGLQWLLRLTARLTRLTAGRSWLTSVVLGLAFGQLGLNNTILCWEESSESVRASGYQCATHRRTGAQL